MKDKIAHWYYRRCLRKSQRILYRVTTHLYAAGVTMPEHKVGIRLALGEIDHLRQRLDKLHDAL